LICERFDVGFERRDVGVEHRDLKVRPIGNVSIHQFTRCRLDDVVNVNRSAARVGPETGIDLLRLDQFVDDSSATEQERTQLDGFIVGELRNARHMALGLQDQRSDTQCSNRVLDEPIGGLMNHASGQRDPALGEIARETPLHRDQPIQRST